MQLAAFRPPLQTGRFKLEDVRLSLRLIPGPKAWLKPELLLKEGFFLVPFPAPVPGLLQPSCGCERALPSLLPTPVAADPVPAQLPNAAVRVWTLCFNPHTLQAVQHKRPWWLGRTNKAAPEQEVPPVQVQPAPVLICCWQKVFHTGFVLGSSSSSARCLADKAAGILPS